MGSRLNTRQTLQGRTVQFKETVRRPLPVLLPSAFSNTQTPLVPVCLFGSQILRSTVLTVWARRMEQWTTLRLRTPKRYSLRTRPKMPNRHQRGVCSSTSPSRKPCSTTTAMRYQDRHPRPCQPWSLSTRSELEISYTSTSAFKRPTHFFIHSKGIYWTQLA
jgi:hypothetical protein